MAKTILIKLGHAVVFLLLGWMALVQLNDPDPLYWVGLYGLCAVVPALALFNKHFPPVNWAAIAYCVLTLGISAAGAFEYLAHHAGQESIIQDMSPDRPYIEITREFFGTLIALSIVAAYQFVGWRRRKADAGIEVD